MYKGTQIGHLKRCQKAQYDEISIMETENLFIHKHGVNLVTVRALQAEKKIHCWRLRFLQITQYSNPQGGVQKVLKNTIVFNGEMIFTLLNQFNARICEQIKQYVPQITPGLQQWCKSPITNIYMVQQKKYGKIGFKDGFIKVTPILFTMEDRVLYYQHRVWTGGVDSVLDEIQQEEGLVGSKFILSYAFDQIDFKIKEFKAEKKKMIEEGSEEKLGESYQYENMEEKEVLEEYSIMD